MSFIVAGRRSIVKFSKQFKYPIYYYIASLL